MDSTIAMDEWISSFSSDHQEFCTASGSAADGQGQVLCVSTKTGKKTFSLNSNSIGSYLGGVNNLYDVLAINY
jgi:hypothetical protein